MGCCISSSAKRDLPHHSPPKPSAPEQHKRSPHVAITSPPPQASLEEETVKEVLSETTIPKPPQSTTQIPNSQEPKNQVQIFQEPNIQARIFEEPKSQVFTNKRKINEKEDEETERTPEISQASEICSIAGTYSTATTATTATTTTITEVREDHEVTSKRRVVNRSPAKLPSKRPYNGEKEKVPRRPPVKREFSGQSRRTATNNNQRSNVGSSRVGRDLGERSGRRSRSPATRATGGVVKGRGGGSPAKVTGKAGGGAAEEGVGVESEVKKEEKGKNNSVLMQQQQQQEGNESLGNPLVSLECFIFL
ncbi:E1A-binding protein p400 [Ricinus communis]|uniref:Uncharacterized protein n=1 Tax=Ricinus communis TaxID=3988 RepID=B9RW48_RICCO|nr:E1A-binding protein p400 [Ricinus communis]EEF44485.1 conserved hypothetical protein [Ricinus communis]|eukprot:XP_002517967.1 E1A-binding protein p400 [Ricinus communis]